MPNAAAIPKRVMFSTATVFIGDLVKSNGINRLMIAGIVTTQRKSSSGRQSIQNRSNSSRAFLERCYPAETQEADGGTSRAF
jgi:hypothetical protein